MSTVVILTHPDCARHAPPSGHPERPDRLAAALAGLQGLDHTPEAAAEAPDEDLTVLHPQRYLDALARKEPARDAVALDPDTWLSPGSLRAARLGAGAALRAVDLVMGGTARAAFAATRPPGHHALASTPMGFCLFGNVALAARRAIDRHGAERVAIVDFDVHHGNGTQALVEEDPRILFVSTHQSPFWPGTGLASDAGPHGTVLNLPLRAGTGSAAFREVVTGQILPRLETHRPDVLLISAGFDAHKDDPLGGLRLETEDFGWVTARLCEVAERHANGRVASVLEGGYDLDALRDGVAAHVAALGGQA
ncbi:histone deacetylase family protein [Rubellimicrobium rubrum]|uniref:Histone deacetylase family protein n=2 Tax=Rubellimicrobium rubrum TaxID=2585369 RepID=A0A5C4MVP1_9RHOB|nr:histone deacetylase family protein [Rubellimicrobium rubrum]TNC48753.1 histone deacetylase family protein [Rubellimicrobium rubrum]